MFSENSSIINPLDELLTAIRWKDGAAEAVDKIHSLFAANDSHAIPLHHKNDLIRRWKLMFQYLETIQNNSMTQLSSKEDHPDWFEGRKYILDKYLMITNETFLDLKVHENCIVDK